MTQDKVPETEINEIPDASAEADGSIDLARLQAENEQLKATIRLSQAHRQITGELENAGARSPELLFASVRDDLQYANDGTLQNAGALVAKLKADFPEQFRSDTVAGSIDAGKGAAGTAVLSKSSLSRMTADEIAKLDWADVKRALSS